MIVDHRRNARRIGIACLGEFGMRPRGAGVDREARRTIAGDGRAAGILQCLPRTSEIGAERSEEHTSELQSLMRISYAVFCLKKKKTTQKRLSKNNHNMKNQNTDET